MSECLNLFVFITFTLENFADSTDAAVNVSIYF